MERTRQEQPTAEAGRQADGRAGGRAGGQAGRHIGPSHVAAAHCHMSQAPTESHLATAEAYQGSTDADLTSLLCLDPPSGSGSVSFLLYELIPCIFHLHHCHGEGEHCTKYCVEESAGCTQ